MTSYGYMFFTFSVHKHGGKTQPLPLGDLLDSPTLHLHGPDSRGDAAIALYGVLNGLRGQRIDENNRHLAVTSVEPEGRLIRFTLDLGTSGQSSVFLDPEADDDEPVFERADRHIEANQRRGLFVVPTNSTVGLLALESQSRSTGREQLTTVLKRAFKAHTNLIIDFNAVVHEEALQAFLAQAQINAITLRRPGLPTDIAEQLEVQQPEAELGRLELTISRGRIKEWTRRLTDKFRRDDTARSRLLSVGGMNFSELNVKMQVGERSTTLSVSADKMPSFVYQLTCAGKPTDEFFYKEVLAMVPEVARAFGANVGTAWQAGSWDEEALKTTIAVPKQEVSQDEGPTEATQ